MSSRHVGLLLELAHRIHPAEGRPSPSTPIHLALFLVPRFDYCTEEDIVINRSFARPQVNAQSLAVDPIGRLVGLNIDAGLSASLRRRPENKTGPTQQ
jgi:hypothetical protein